MQELEKILEEIEALKECYEEHAFSCLMMENTSVAYLTNLTSKLQKLEHFR